MSDRNYSKTGTAQRFCLKCQREFRSKSSSNRICNTCDKQAHRSKYINIPRENKRHA